MEGLIGTRMTQIRLYADIFNANDANERIKMKEIRVIRLFAIFALRFFVVENPLSTKSARSV